MGYMFEAKLDPRLRQLDGVIIDTCGLFPRSRTNEFSLQLVGEEIEARARSCGVGEDFLTAAHTHFDMFEDFVYGALDAGKLLIPEWQEAETIGVSRKIREEQVRLPTKLRNRVDSLYDRQVNLLRAVSSGKTLPKPKVTPENARYLSLTLDWLGEDPKAHWNRSRGAEPPSRRDILFAEEFLALSGNGSAIGLVTADRSLVQIARTAYRMRRDTFYRKEKPPVFNTLYDPRVLH